MPIYYLTTDYGIRLTVFDVERETKQLYFVHNGRSLSGNGKAYARRLNKSDPAVFTDWPTALLAYRAALELSIAGLEKRLANYRRQLADADTLQPPAEEQGEAQ